MDPTDHLLELRIGTPYPLSEWPKPNKVPKIAVGVYTIWDQDDHLILRWHVST
jgi:hypothetical protein